MVAQVSGECKKKQDIKQGGGRRRTDRQTLYSKTQNLCKVRTWRGAQMSTQVQAASVPIISEKSGTELHNLPGTVLPSLNGLSVQSSSGVREAYYSCFCFLGGVTPYSPTMLPASLSVPAQATPTFPDSSPFRTVGSAPANTVVAAGPAVEHPLMMH